MNQNADKPSSAPAESTLPAADSATAKLTAALSKPAEKSPDAAEPAGVDAAGKPAGEAPPAPPAVAVSTADVQRIVSEAIAKDRESREGENARERFIRERMMDLPNVLRDAMPKTGDLRELSRIEQEIRRQYVESLKKIPGYKVPNVGGDNPGGAPPMQTFNNTKMSPTQKLAQALSKG